MFLSKSLIIPVERYLESNRANGMSLSSYNLSLKDLLEIMATSHTKETTKTTAEKQSERLHRNLNTK